MVFPDWKQFSGEWCIIEKAIVICKGVEMQNDEIIRGCHAHYILPWEETLKAIRRTDRAENRS
jgi:hypothetical protein